MNPKDTALLVIDMQKDFCCENSKYNLEGYPIYKNKKLALKISRVLDSFKNKGVKIISVTSNYSNYKIRGKMCEFCSSNNSSDNWIKFNYDKVIIKKTHDAFYKTSLDSYLKNNKIKNLLFVGISTSVCVDTGARGGVVRGYDVFILKDLVTSRKIRFHLSALDNFKNNFGCVEESNKILKQL